MSCTHCGQVHADMGAACPVTRLPMGTPGLIGTQIDRYKLEGLLGQGGFGTVYRARHVHTDATVALKLLKKELGADQGMLDRFMREAKAASAVGSEHIVGVLDAGVTEGQAFLALEFLDGWDLKDLVYREGADDPKRLIAIVLQVLAGLAAAHAKGIVHRDMKPANIFIIQRAEKDFVKVLDFGISKMQQEGPQGGLTMTGVAIGTPSYMSPEQFFDARSVDGRSDLYSVAVMLYEFLAKRLPFDAQSYAELVVKVRTETPAPLRTIAPELPAALCAVVDKGLARDREGRWQTAQQLAEALREASGPGWTPGNLRATPVSRPAEHLSMLMEKTSPPKGVPPTPAFGPNQTAVQLPPQSFGSSIAPVPAGVPARPIPVPAQPTVSSGALVAKWIIIGIVAISLGCCALGIVDQLVTGSGRSAPPHPSGDEQVHAYGEDNVDDGSVPEGPGAQR